MILICVADDQNRAAWSQGSLHPAAVLRAGMTSLMFARRASCVSSLLKWTFQWTASANYKAALVDEGGMKRGGRVCWSARDVHDVGRGSESVEKSDRMSV